MASKISLHDLPSRHLPAPVPIAVLTPESHAAMPLCVLLLGAGGTRENLADLQPIFDEWWSEGLEPAVLAVPSPGMDYYLEDAAGSLRWDSFLAENLIPSVHASSRTNGATFVVGISGGGYGALKLAFARPDLFTAVAAMQPMLEPGLHASHSGTRNRLHHAAGGPPQLIGPARDAALWEANNPANRAHANAQAIRRAELAIYIDAAGRDFLNAHDGAEFLHRTLWDLDLAHEYHLVRDADHGGPTLRPRMRRMFAWLSALLRPPVLDAAVEQTATAWLESGMKGKPPQGATTTDAFVTFLRAQFAPLRKKAAESDPAVTRRYGVL
ncbi:MAG TPA: alpha/beta hydrolase-fold protein [Bryobacteraceae bacterium]|jgi:S-formylglutathione hydrolase|nr:alpha/beta hydrolase-fold protein [Bryobacteraceae bacterium]